MNKENYAIASKLVKNFYNSLDYDTVIEYIRENGLITQNTKLFKGKNMNFGLELLPSKLCGVINTCGREGNCKYNCIAFTGINNMLKSKNGKIKSLSTSLQAKAKRTWLFVNDKEKFLLYLKADIMRLKYVAQAENKKLALRLNTTSDIDWQEFTNTLPDIQFYDYTKFWERKSTSNYHYTFSYSEKIGVKKLIAMLQAGENIAMVFNKVPDEYCNFKVIDGDINDNRYEDPQGIIVGLKFKYAVTGGKHNTGKFLV